MKPALDCTFSTLAGTTVRWADSRKPISPSPGRGTYKPGTVMRRCLIILSGILILQVIHPIVPAQIYGLKIVFGQEDTPAVDMGLL